MERFDVSLYFVGKVSEPNFLSDQEKATVAGLLKITMTNEEIDEFVSSISQAKRIELNIHFRDLVRSLLNQEDYRRVHHREGMKQEKANQASIIQKIYKLIEIYRREKSTYKFADMARVTVIGAGLGVALGFWLSYEGMQKVDKMHGIIREFLRKKFCEGNIISELCSCNNNPFNNKEKCETMTMDGCSRRFSQEENKFPVKNPR